MQSACVGCALMNGDKWSDMSGFPMRMRMGGRGRYKCQHLYTSRTHLNFAIITVFLPTFDT